MEYLVAFAVVLVAFYLYRKWNENRRYDKQTLRPENKSQASFTLAMQCESREASKPSQWTQAFC